MATETVSANLRLQALERLCGDISSAIHRARHVLRENAEDPEAAYLVADALDRVGWMADKAVKLTGFATEATVSGAEEWMFGPVLNERIREMEAEVSHG
jgi:hypothetical protein